MARKSLFGISSYFRNDAVTMRDSFWRYQEKAQGIPTHGVEGMTLDNHSLQRMHSFACFCACKMFRCPKKPEEDINSWSPRKYVVEARRKFQSRSRLLDRCRSRLADAS
eukprot:3630157-Pyramimonas_sp.AAC.1